MKNAKILQIAWEPYNCYMALVMDLCEFFKTGKTNAALINKLAYAHRMNFYDTDEAQRKMSELIVPLNLKINLGVSA